jgi:hypothetical protein
MMGNGGGLDSKSGIDETGSELTVENVRDFENSIAPSDDGMNSFLGNNNNNSSSIQHHPVKVGEQLN